MLSPAVVVLRRTRPVGQQPGEGGIAQATAQLAQLEDGGCQRALADHLDNGLGWRVVDLAIRAFGAWVTRFQIGRVDFHHRGVAIGLYAVAPVPAVRRGRIPITLGWCCAACLLRLAEGARGVAGSAHAKLLEQVAFALRARTEQHLTKAFDRGLGVLQGPHHVDKGSKHPNQQLVLLGRQCRLGQRQYLVEFGLRGADEFGGLHAGDAANAVICDNRWRKSLTSG